jgi:hypothetical protein
MNNRKNRQGILERFCQFLGRQHFASDFLDAISNWLLLQQAFAFDGNYNFGLPIRKAKTVDKLAGPQIVQMARPTQWHNGADPNGRTAPSVPGGTNQGAPRSESIFPWRYIVGPLGWFWHERAKSQAKKNPTVVPCSDAKYHGMHGQPCKFAGGSDTKCPVGTTSGWFWAYDVPSLGRMYYVDCCGIGGSASDVWCEWTSEPDWCNGWGRAHNKGISGYNCTLAIPEADMNVVDLGGGNYEVGGVDA